jgi:hypothetical protein
MRKENIKMVEIRDRATCIPAFAILMLPENQDEVSLMRQTGYGFSHPCVMLVSIEAPWHSARSSDEWQERSVRTMAIAHKYIEDNFSNISECQVIDVEFILGEVDAPCKSCRQEQLDEADKILREQADNE